MNQEPDYYRVLQVQPDAHEAVIRASYRTLMQVLRLHPDLGGDAERAALLNRAMAVLVARHLSWLRARLQHIEFEVVASHTLANLSRREADLLVAAIEPHPAQHPPLAHRAPDLVDGDLRHPRA